MAVERSTERVDIRRFHSSTLQDGNRLPSLLHSVVRSLRSRLGRASVIKNGGFSSPKSSADGQSSPLSSPEPREGSDLHGTGTQNSLLFLTANNVGQRLFAAERPEEVGRASRSELPTLGLPPKQHPSTSSHNDLLSTAPIEVLSSPQLLFEPPSHAQSDLLPKLRMGSTSVSGAGSNHRLPTLSAAGPAPDRRLGRSPNRQAAVGPAPCASSRLLTTGVACPPEMLRNRKSWSLEDYIVQKRLYKGSTSAVYKAACRYSGLTVALKVYFLSRIPPNAVHMLKREIEIHSQLAHTNIVRLYGAFMDDQERAVLVQEFAPRGDLYEMLQRMGGRMQPDQVAQSVLRPFLEALGYIHSQGICHRDIKPENLLFSGSWRIMVADFGVSVDLNRERAVTRAGTEGYMAPEVERCPLKSEPLENKDNLALAYSTAVDIWAVGVLAYELLTGFPPAICPSPPTAGAASGRWPGGGAAASSSSSSVNFFVRNNMTAASLHFPASVPHQARSFITAALATDPRDRPTAMQMLQHPWMTAAAAAAAAAATAARRSAAAAADMAAAAAAAAPAAPPGGLGDNERVQEAESPAQRALSPRRQASIRQLQQQQQQQRGMSRFASVSEVIRSSPGFPS